MDIREKLKVLRKEIKKVYTPDVLQMQIAEASLGLPVIDHDVTHIIYNKKLYIYVNLWSCYIPSDDIKKYAIPFNRSWRMGPKELVYFFPKEYINDDCDPYKYVTYYDEGDNSEIVIFKDLDLKTLRDVCIKICTLKKESESKLKRYYELNDEIEILSAKVRKEATAKIAKTKEANKRIYLLRAIRKYSPSFEDPGCSYEELHSYLEKVTKEHLAEKRIKWNLKNREHKFVKELSLLTDEQFERIVIPEYLKRLKKKLI